MTEAQWYDALDAESKAKVEGAVVYDRYFSGILGCALIKGVWVLVYSRTLSIKELADDFYRDSTGLDPAKVSDDGCNEKYSQAWEEAEEFFDFNVAGGWVGDRTPLILDDQDPEPIEAAARWWKGFAGWACRCSEEPVALFRFAYCENQELAWLDRADGELKTAPAVELQPLRQAARYVGLKTGEDKP